MKPASRLMPSPSQIRFHAATLVLFFLNVFVLIPILAVPTERLYRYLLFPPLLIMNIWALLLILFPVFLQKSYVVFRGVFGVVCSLSLLFIMQLFAYSMLNLDTPLFAIGTLFAYGFALYDYLKRNRKKAKRQTNTLWRKQKNNNRSSLGWSRSVASLVGLGYLVANVTLGFVTQQFVVVVLILSYGMLSYTVFHFVLELERYFSPSR
ncbi:fatty acid desaturase [Paenibacillus turicensis]|uniref:Fatty acid desaturase n=2 Tax=Paenibacillus turicensis TaxID=160487 RepID=A0ABS4FY93_9BACL|nr:fatty acid desaturase [Paenibacillus turicensis]